MIVGQASGGEQAGVSVIRRACRFRVYVPERARRHRLRFISGVLVVVPAVLHVAASSLFIGVGAS